MLKDSASILLELEEDHCWPSLTVQHSVIHIKQLLVTIRSSTPIVPINVQTGGGCYSFQLLNMRLKQSLAIKPHFIIFFNRDENTACCLDYLWFVCDP